MKSSLFAAVVATVTVGFAVPSLAADVNVSVRIGDPNFYGRIDIGGYPPPRVIYREPIVVERRVERRAPIYLRVPPGHAKRWSKYCHRYHACGERVFFVRDDWYRGEYVPRHRARVRDRWDDRRDRHEDWQDRRDDRPGRRDDRQDDRRGPPAIDRGDGHPGNSHGRGR